MESFIRYILFLLRELIFVPMVSRFRPVFKFSKSALSSSGVNNNTWLLSASELYRSSDRRLSAKLVPTFADREVSRGQLGGFPMAVISVF
jgi:hypothetical protein